MSDISNWTTPDRIEKIHLSDMTLKSKARREALESGLPLARHKANAHAGEFCVSCPGCIELKRQQEEIGK